MSIFEVNIEATAEPREVQVSVSAGEKGWSAQPTIVQRGEDDYVVHIGWIGGTGNPPAGGGYLAVDGYTENIEEAVRWNGIKGDKPAHAWDDTALSFENPDGSFADPVDLKGDKGDQGYKGWSLMPVAVERGTGDWVMQITWVGGTGEPPAEAGYVAEGGMTDNIEDAVRWNGLKGSPGRDAPMVLGTTAGTAAEGDDERINNGQLAYEYLVSQELI